MEKFVVITYLFDFYQDLLTEKQSNLLREYYFEDLSLGEMAQQHGISRQSAFDTIKKQSKNFWIMKKSFTYFQSIKVMKKHSLKLKNIVNK